MSIHKKGRNFELEVLKLIEEKIPNKKVIRQGIGMKQDWGDIIVEDLDFHLECKNYQDIKTAISIGIKDASTHTNKWVIFAKRVGKSDPAESLAVMSVGTFIDLIKSLLEKPISKKEFKEIIESLDLS